MLLVVVGVDSPHDILRDVQGELPHAGAAKLLDDPAAGAIVALGGIGGYVFRVAKPICSARNTHPPELSCEWEHKHRILGGGEG